jgi:hypothetical protein
MQLKARLLLVYNCYKPRFILRYHLPSLYRIPPCSTQRLLKLQPHHFHRVCVLYNFFHPLLCCCQCQLCFTVFPRNAMAWQNPLVTRKLYTQAANQLPLSCHVIGPLFYKFNNGRTCEKLHSGALPLQRQLQSANVVLCTAKSVTLLKGCSW